MALGWHDRKSGAVPRNHWKPKMIKFCLRNGTGPLILNAIENDAGFYVDLTETTDNFDNITDCSF